MLLQSTDFDEIKNKVKKKSLIDYLTKNLSKITKHQINHEQNKSIFRLSDNKSNLVHLIKDNENYDTDYEDEKHRIYNHNETIFTTDSINLVDFINEIFSNYISKEYVPFILSGILLFLIISAFFICCCSQKNKFKSIHLSQNKFKMKATNLKSNQPVSTSALATKTISQNDETMSLSNIAIDTELNLIAQIKENKDNINLKTKRRQLSRVQSKDHLTDLGTTDQSVISKFSNKQNESIRSRIRETPLLAGSEIDEKGTQRIKRFTKSRKKNKLKPNKSRQSEIKRKLHRTKKSSKTSIKTKKDSIITFKDKSTDNSKSMDPFEELDTKAKKSNAKDLDDTKNNQVNQLVHKSNRQKIKKRKNRKQNEQILSFKKLSRKSMKPKKGKSKEPEIFKMSSLNIYNKKIKFKNKSNELVSIFNQIPSLDASKLPPSKELYSPPSVETLKKGKAISIDQTSSSGSSSEELLISNLKRYKAKSKDKIKTKSTEPLLDGEIH